MAAHKVKWQAHRREEYRKKVRKEYLREIQEMRKNERKRIKDMADRQRDAMRQRMFKKQFAGMLQSTGQMGARQMDFFKGRTFQKMKNQQYIQSLANNVMGNTITSSTNGQHGIMRRRLRNRRSRNRWRSAQVAVDRIHEENDYDARITKKTTRQLDKRRDDEELATTYALGEYEEDMSHIDEDLAMDDLVKCTMFYNNTRVYQLCIDHDGLTVKEFIRAERKEMISVIATHDNDTLLSLNVTEDDYLNFMEYEDLKYKVTSAMGGDEGSGLYSQSAIVGIQSYLEGEDFMHCYHLESRQFVYDPDSNHRRQCWTSIYEFELCLEMEDREDRPDIVLQAIPPSNGGTLATYSFADDLQWDEVNVIEDNTNEHVIAKCTHAFAARICLEETASISEPQIVAYVVRVYIEHADLQ